MILLKPCIFMCVCVCVSQSSVTYTLTCFQLPECDFLSLMMQDDVTKTVQSISSFTCQRLWPDVHCSQLVGVRMNQTGTETHRLFWVWIKWSRAGEDEASERKVYSQFTAGNYWHWNITSSIKTIKCFFKPSDDDQKRHNQQQTHCELANTVALFITNTK